MALDAADDGVGVVSADSVSGVVSIAGSLLGSYAGKDHKVRLRLECMEWIFRDQARLSCVCGVFL